MAWCIFISLFYNRMLVFVAEAHYSTLVLKHHGDQVLVSTLPLLQPLLGAPLYHGRNAFQLRFLCSSEHTVGIFPEVPATNSHIQIVTIFWG